MEERIGSTIAEFMAAEGNDIPIPEEERLRQVQAIWNELEYDGLICRTGQLRDGWPVYVATNKSRGRDRAAGAVRPGRSLGQRGPLVRSCHPPHWAASLHRVPPSRFCPVTCLVFDFAGDFFLQA
jgi:hypothetical protein